MDAQSHTEMIEKDLPYILVNMIYLQLMVSNAIYEFLSYCLFHVFYFHAHEFLHLDLDLYSLMMMYIFHVSYLYIQSMMVCIMISEHYSTNY